ncbi:DUF2968 domain-containing protein [Paraburkholderia sp. D15]|uniref:DUF2968 domain-containing protein n=1 Tax=Paraburkholderia sp. D15 TaxID=2880218 RepID=UPI00247AA2C7|nr:DUF2968 domain-containing protein [Paraburkholderia sp. D15]WGS49038.1 DUF2968 domain-containing protein [Paraburkholderia sp. D15]
MKHPLLMWRAVLVAASCALSSGGGVMAAQGETAAPRNASSAAIASAASVTTAASVLSTDAQGNVAELTQLIHDAKLSELRTTYNGSYGASLFFYPRQMAYYVALFQDKHFWRVIRTDDTSRAESMYAGFAQQTAQLADVEIRRMQLQAQKAYLEDIIAMSTDRAKRLQADLNVARTQQARVDDYQRQTQGEAAALRMEKDKVQAQLRQVQGEVIQLQRQTEAGLPPRN